MALFNFKFKKMSLTERAILDAQFITQNLNGFAVSMVLTAPNIDTVTVLGLATKHHNGFDVDGVHVSTKMASVSITENQLIGYPCRTTGGNLDFEGHNLAVKDSTAITQNYRITEWFPDEALGLIILKLADLS
jgi:hypothetical protein